MNAPIAQQLRSAMASVAILAEMLSRSTQWPIYSTNPHPGANLWVKKYPSYALGRSYNGRGQRLCNGIGRPHGHDQFVSPTSALGRKRPYTAVSDRMTIMFLAGLLLSLKQCCPMGSGSFSRLTFQYIYRRRKALGHVSVTYVERFC